MSYKGCKCEPECFSFSDHVGTGPYVSATATASRSQSKEVADTIAREKRWGPDMAAYKRLRKDGCQPKTVIGSANLEKDARDPIEIRHGKIYGEKLEGVKEVSALVKAANSGEV